MEHPALLDLVLVFVRGLCMGIADAIPGVSGGTIAFITGIYDRLLHAINSVKGKWLSLLLRGKFKDSFSALKEIHFSFLLPLLTGIGLSLYLFSGVVNALLSSHPAVTYAFFFGLIIASAWLLSKKIHLLVWRNVLGLVFGFVLAYLIGGATAAMASHSLPLIFLSAALAICAMVLPGISGAFILLLLGQYQFLIQALQGLNTAVLLTFGVGAVVGLLSFVKVLDYILHHHRALTLSFLTGLMVGSLRVPFVSIVGNGGASWPVFLWGIAGFLLVFILEKIFDRKSSLSK